MTNLYKVQFTIKLQMPTKPFRNTTFKENLIRRTLLHLLNTRKKIVDVKDVIVLPYDLTSLRLTDDCK